MATTTARTGTAPFAHLLALVTGGKTNAKKAEDEKENDPEAEDPEDDPEAESEEDDEKAESDESDEPEKKPEGKRARKAKAEDPDDEDKAESSDDDEEMAEARREGFAASQARGRKIFGAASAALRPDMAAHLAFNETMPSAQAIAMLDLAAKGVMPEGGGSRLARRMARVEIPNPGTGGTGKASEMSFGEMAKAAAQKAGIL